ncbi:MAG: tetratricopeptide repeat protein, partial [Planctomycetaceae bacterium]|nr:tetratricopeptide repeat protein [Planctomycetaceae bacterium]
MRRTRSILLPGLLLLAACGDDPPPPPKPAPPPPAPAPVQGVAPSRVAAVLAPMNRGLALIERYDYGGAATEFAKAVALEPAFYPAQFNLSVALVNNQKDPAVSEKALRAAAALAPKEAAPHFMLGMLLTQGVSPPRTKEAAVAFRRAAELAPGDADAHFRLGLAAKEDGRVEEAEREFTKALDLNPFLGAALYQRGLNRMQLDREEEGKADLGRFKAMETAQRVDKRDIAYGFMGPLGNCIRDLDRWLPPGEPPLRARVVWAEAADAFADPADG